MGSALEGARFEVWAINSSEDYAEAGGASHRLDERLRAAAFGRPTRPS